MKSITRTLRFRLMAWNAAVVVLTAAATLGSLREGVRYALYHELDQLHLEDSQQIALMLQDRPVDYPDLYEALQQHADGHHQHGWFVALFDNQGGLLWASEKAPAAALVPSPSATDRRVTEAGDIRYLYRNYPDSSGQIQAIHVGSHLQSIYDDMARIDRQAALAAGAVLLLAPAGGYWLAGRATKPLAAMMTTSVRLRPSHLDERLPLQGSGDELDQLAATINALLDRIAVHLERKRDFLANAAHELRTPLAAIRSSIEVTLNEPRRVEEYEELLDELIEENGHLERLVNQLLLLSESDAEGPSGPLQHVLLPPLVERSVEMFRGVAEAKGIQLSGTYEPCSVSGNLDHLRQVVNNLLDNAVKFTPPKGRIEVTVGPTHDPGFAEIVVRDSGIGIAEADQDRVFERFYRSGGPRAEGAHARGTGLGLSICESVIAAHGGTIRLESAPNAGTTVTVRLPSEVSGWNIPQAQS